jgi:hypothetical protein
MNGFLKGFMSLFDWMSPRSLDEQMQDLYDKMGWGKYNNPMPMSPRTPVNPSWNTACDLTRSISSEEWNNLVKNNATVEEVYGNVKIVTSSQFLDEMLRLVPSGSFVPYAFYNEDMDSIDVYFKNDSCYTQPLNEAMNLHLSHDKDEVVGLTILNVKKLLQTKGLP